MVRSSCYTPYIYIYIYIYIHECISSYPTPPHPVTHKHRDTHNQVYIVQFVDLRRLGKDARALPTYTILKVKQPICTFIEADIFVLLQYGVRHSTRLSNFPATYDVIITNNTLCTEHIGQTSHLVIKIDITLTVLCFQVKTLRFSL